MDNLKFKKILFKVAFCTMTCDGHIDEREIEEIKAMGSGTPFFNGVDFLSELTVLVESLSVKGTRIIEDLLQEIRSSKFSVIQELLMLEVAIRIINSDDVVDVNEIKFIKLIRSKLSVPDEVIIDRFGDLPILGLVDFGNEVDISSSPGIEIDGVDFKNIDSLIFDFTKLNKS